MTPESKAIDTGMSFPSPEELERAMRAGEHERAQMAGVLWREVTEAVHRSSQRLGRRLQSLGFSPGTTAMSDPNATR